jgi:L-lactate dehydrogenase complex protein LldG
MTTPREAILQSVRQALRAGNRPGEAAVIEPRGSIGYQGAEPDPVSRFCQELTATGGHAHVVSDRQAAIACTLELVKASTARRILLGPGNFIDSLNLPEHLAALGCDVKLTGSLPAAGNRDLLFAADLGISGVDYLIAETGTVVVLAKPKEPRSLSLLPPVHIALAERAQLVPDLFDLFESEVRKGQTDLPSCVSLITGPSKTGDIELRLVTGVHGPGEIHVILLND